MGRLYDLKMVVVLAMIMVGVGCGPVHDQQAEQILALEKQANVYADQLDSMDVVVDGLDERVGLLSSQVDSVQSSNRILVQALQKVTNSMKEFRRMYDEQKTQNAELKKEVADVKAQRNKAMVQAMQMAGKVDSLDEVLVAQRNRIVRLEASLRSALDREALAQKAISQVFVHVGTLKELREGGYLEVRQQTILTDTYKLIGFPQITDKRVKRVSINDDLIVDGKVRFIVDRHGKLKWGKSYRSWGQGAKSTIKFEEDSMQGQRVLVVLK